MIEKEELIERIENTLTTRMIKQLFISIVEQCNDVKIDEKFLIKVANDYGRLSNENNNRID